MISIVKNLWRRFEAHLLSRPSLALIMITIFALTLASGERTYEGMHNFTENRLLSILITLGVQIMMIVLAWRIGDAYATTAEQRVPALFRPLRGPRTSLWFAGFRRALKRNFVVQNVFLLGSFLICAIICVFFSFDSFFQIISKGDRRTIIAEKEAREIARKIDVELGKKLDEQQDSLALRLASGPDWEKYKLRITDVTSATTDPKLARDVSDRSLLQQKQDEEDYKIVLQAVENAKLAKNKAEVERDGLLDAKEKLTKELETLEAEYNKDDATLKSFRDAVAAKEREVREALVRRDNENTTGNLARNKKGGLNSGVGPLYREFARIHKALSDELAALRRSIDPARIERDNQANQLRRQQIERQLQPLNLAIANATTNADLIQIPVLPPRKGPIDPSQISDPGLLAAIGDGKELAGMLSQFASLPSRAAMVSMEKQCEKVVGALRAIPEARPKAEPLRCSAWDGAYTLLGNLRDLEQRHAELLSKCSGVNILDLAFKDLLRHSETCLQIAKLSDSGVEQLENKLGRLRLEHDDKAHAFTRTIAAFERGDRLAYLAMIMALALDGLVLMSGMWGARTSVSPLTRSGDETASEIDGHAALMMMMETRPEESRPRGGWQLPAEVYKARLFVKHLMPINDDERPELAGTISFAHLDDTERDAIKSVLTIGPFAWPADRRADPDTWLVDNRLVRYTTQIAANHDRLERLRRPEVPVSSEMSRFEPGGRGTDPLTQAAYWTSAAANANQPTDAGTTDNGAMPEDKLVDLGFQTVVDDTAIASNDDPIQKAATGEPTSVRAADRAASS